jgi:hypothetical protein
VKWFRKPSVCKHDWRPVKTGYDAANPMIAGATVQKYVCSRCGAETAGA